MSFCKQGSCRLLHLACGGAARSKSFRQSGPRVPRSLSGPLLVAVPTDAHGRDRGVKCGFAMTIEPTSQFLSNSTRDDKPIAPWPQGELLHWYRRVTVVPLGVEGFFVEKLGIMTLRCIDSDRRSFPVRKAASFARPFDINASTRPGRQQVIPR
ncbi:hypothetical protein P154DRAFT_571361 [Amniculicola lignicola CBS 123094]|uniref:Uncharacterized protein n=1 Tax=Amniculicola lignicola CBS 123094 TaxID=1392246 RepID=A0A6A5WU79_9PLEO|nr:hypothetical protein P154DRAFT_571361 [Amniculicola lignicola CBS 123094]